MRVSVREHAQTLRDRLVRVRAATFRTLCADCQSTLEVVARFLALLELYREGLVAFEQVAALGELTIRWTGGDDVEGLLDIDEYAGEPPPVRDAPSGDVPPGDGSSGDEPSRDEPSRDGSSGDEPSRDVAVREEPA
jgi:segregation and condensation protein A